MRDQSRCVQCRALRLARVNGHLKLKKNTVLTAGTASRRGTRLSSTGRVTWSMVCLMEVTVEGRGKCDFGTISP